MVKERGMIRLLAEWRRNLAFVKSFGKFWHKL
jgi:hypothetical protein